MPIAEQSKVFSNFTKGLNTEATGLNFPEDAAVDLDNVELFTTGEVKRRLGLDFEGGYSLSADVFAESTLTTAAISTHEWRSVNSIGELNFLALQIGLKIYFYDLGAEPVSGTLVGSVDLDSFSTNSNAASFLIDASFGEGRMLVTSRFLEPLYIEYDGDTATFSTHMIQLLIRDFDGLVDGFEVNERPATLTPEHRYNLLNQGWPLKILASLNQQGDGAPVDLDPVQQFKTVLGVYPSNSDSVLLGKLGAAEDAANIGTFHPIQVTKFAASNTPSPKGHFILNPFNRARSQVQGYNESGYTVGGILPFGLNSISQPTIFINLLLDPSTEPDPDLERPTATEFFAGRVWYAGAAGAANTGDLFYSQTLTDMKEAGRCYQQADPTAEDTNNLVDTDGGVVHISDMGEVQKMIDLGQDLVVIANNGVWAVSGSTGSNFKATDFTVRKLSDVGTLSAQSILVADGVVLWWSQGGIYTMTSGQIDDELQITRISQQTVQTFFDEIPAAARAYSRGFFDDFNKKIYWFYNDDPGYDGIDFRFSYNKALALDLTLGAFYPLSFADLDTNTPFIAAMTQKEVGTEAQVTYDIKLGNDNIVLSGDDIVLDVAFPSFADANLKLVTFQRDIDVPTDFTFTFGEFINRSFTDWETWDQVANDVTNTGAEYVSFIQGAWQHFGDPLPLKKLTHLVSYFNRTETGYELDEMGNIVFTDPSGATVQVRWEWTDADVGRWTQKQEAYRLNRFYIPEDENDPFDFGETIIKTKLAMRGKGHAFGVRYESLPGKDMQLIGFGVNMRAGTKL